MRSGVVITTFDVSAPYGMWFADEYSPLKLRFKNGGLLKSFAIINAVRQTSLHLKYF